MGEQKVMIGDKCAEIYTYELQDLVYAMNWSVSSAQLLWAGCNILQVNAEVTTWRRVVCTESTRL